MWKGITEAAEKADVPLQFSRIGSIMTPFFTSESVRDYESAIRADTQKFGEFHRKLLEQGVYWPPSQFEAAFVSQAHNEEDIEITIRAIEKAL